MGVALGLAAALIAPAALRAAEVRKESSRELPAEGIRGLRVQNPAGLIEIRGETRPDFLLEAHYRLRADKESFAKELLDRMDLGVEEKAGRLVVFATFDGEALGSRRWTVLRETQTRVDILVRSPKEMGVEAGVTGGELRVQDLEGDAELSATSGDVEVLRLGGDLLLNVTSGDVRLDEIGGRVNATSTAGRIIARQIGASAWLQSLSGDVFVADVDGDLDIQNLTGGISARNVEGALSVNSSSGEITLELPGGPVRANSSSGNITLRTLAPAGQSLNMASSSGLVEVILLESSSFDLDLNTSTGSIRCRVPLDLQDVSRRNLRAIMGRGGPALQVVTASGDIRILQQEE